MQRGKAQSIDDALASLPPGEIRDMLREMAEAFYTPLERQTLALPLLELPPADMDIVKAEDEMREAIMRGLCVPAHLLRGG